MMEVGKGRNNNKSKTSSSSSSSSAASQNEEEMSDLRRGPWTVEEDFKLINYIATHGEGRWNSLARCAGLKRTGKSCRLRWLNYLRPDVRRGNITLEEQLLILELHSRWGNRWSKIAQHLPGRTDNEIKNYWRTRVQKHAKQLKCDVNSKQFKDTMRYLWMPRLIERIQAAAAAAAGTASATAATATNATCSTASAVTTGPTATNVACAAAPAAKTHHLINNTDVGMGHLVMGGGPGVIGANNHHDFGVAQVTPSYTPENSSTAASSDSFGTQVSPVSDMTTDHYYNIPAVNHNPNQDNYFQAGQQVGYSDTLISPTGYYNQGLDFQAMEHNNPWFDGTDNLWSVDDIWFLQQQFNNSNI